MRSRRAQAERVKRGGMNRFLLSTALCTLGFVYAGAANAQTVPNTPAQQEAQSDPNAIVITASAANNLRRMWALPLVS